MIILGINAYHADSSAAIFVDGRMIAAIEEERFTRVKHWAGFPKRLPCPVYSKHFSTALSTKQFRDAAVA